MDCPLGRIHRMTGGIKDVLSGRGLIPAIGPLPRLIKAAFKYLIVWCRSD